MWPFPLAICKIVFPFASRMLERDAEPYFLINSWISSRSPNLHERRNSSSSSPDGTGKVDITVGWLSSYPSVLGIFATSHESLAIYGQPSIRVIVSRRHCLKLVHSTRPRPLASALLDHPTQPGQPLLTRWAPSSCATRSPNEFTFLFFHLRYTLATVIYHLRVLPSFASSPARTLYHFFFEVSTYVAHIACSYPCLGCAYGLGVYHVLPTNAKKNDLDIYSWDYSWLFICGLLIDFDASSLSKSLTSQ